MPKFVLIIGPQAVGKMTVGQVLSKITGYKLLYNHMTIELVRLKFDYDKELIANMMVSISKLDNAPMCQINFGLKDERKCRRDLLTSAYKDAENQAQAIAEASGKTLKYCQKVDFKPFTTNYVSQAIIDSDMMYAEKACSGVTQTIVNTFTPEDIELSEILYCLWIAE